MARAVCSSAPLSGAAPFSEHTGWAEGSCVTSRRFHEAVLRVIGAGCNGRLTETPGEVSVRFIAIPIKFDGT
jgi:hypothetical protein